MQLWVWWKENFTVFLKCPQEKKAMEYLYTYNTVIWSKIMSCCHPQGTALSLVCPSCLIHGFRSKGAYWTEHEQYILVLFSLQSALARGRITSLLTKQRLLLVRFVQLSVELVQVQSGKTLCLQDFIPAETNKQTNKKPLESKHTGHGYSVGTWKGTTREVQSPHYQMSL